MGNMLVAATQQNNYPEYRLQECFYEFLDFLAVLLRPALAAN